MLITAIGTTLGVVGIAQSTPSLDTMFDLEERTSFSLDSDEQASVYATGSDEGSVECTHSPGIDLEETDSGFSFTTDGNTWYRVLDITAQTGGEHEIQCQSEEDLQLAIGDKANAGRLVGSVFGIFGGLCLGAIVGGVIALIVVLKRKSNKDNLVRQRSGSGGWSGYPPQPGAYPPVG